VGIKVIMRLISSVLLDWLKPVLRAFLAGALHSALLFALSISAQAADENGGGVLLQGGKMSAEGFYEFSFETGRNVTYPISASTDMFSWTALTNLVGRAASISFVDRDASQFPQRFYRIGSVTAVPTPITNMVFIPPGTFTMGSSESENGRDTNEGPRTVVTISRGFWIGKYEVTQAEFISLMGSNISVFSYNVNLPLDYVNWFQATNYCYKLTQTERAAGRLPPGYTYRLPTEAEWEYACRAGTTNAVAVGNGTSLSSTQANFDGNFPYGGAAQGPYVNLTRLGGSYAPNAWGLYDMHGNVWEWCQDLYGPYPGGLVTDPKGATTGSTHVLRGGGFTSLGKGCRSAERDSRAPTYAHTIQGLRVILASDP
jgi:formylglycine-generating enzyme required for sulfatase activity